MKTIENNSTMKTEKKDLPVSYRNVMVLSHFCKHNMIFETYCNGIKANSSNYYFVDYRDLYVQAGKKKFEEKIEALVVENGVNYIFFVLWSGDLTFDIHFAERLSKMAFIVMNFFDTEYYFEPVDRYYAQIADLVLLPDYLSKYRYELLNINVMSTFSLFSKHNYSRSSDSERNIDVSFVGSLIYKNRKEYIDCLIENKVKVEPYGDLTVNGFVSFDKMIDIFRKSKINLNFTGIDSDRGLFPLNINNRIKASRGRPIEVALCGGFVLSEYAPGIENMFEIGKEIDVFHTKRELLDKIGYYLANEKEREEIARRGYERAVKNYDAETAFANIFGDLHRYKKIDSNVYLDKCFIRNYATFRIWNMCLCLFEKRYKNFLEELCIFLKYRKIEYRAAWKCFRYMASVYLSKHEKMKNILKKILFTSKDA